MMNKQWKNKGLIALALAAVLLPACATEQPTAEAPVEEEVATGAADEPVNVEAEDVTNNTEALIGQTVTVRSNALEAVGDSSFTLSDEQFFGSEPILVINATGEPFALPTDSSEIQVTGEVRNLVVADVEQEFDLDFEDELYVEYENQPAIIAQSIAPAPEPGEITSNPEEYYNQTIAVTGEVENVQSPTTFTLDEEQLFGSEDLLVLNQNPDLVPTDGETVAVTGVVRPFVVAELERDYDLTWDLEVQQQLEAEYSNRPVLVADNIYPSAIPE